MPKKTTDRRPAANGNSVLQTTLPMFPLKLKKDSAYEINHRLSIKRRTCCTFIRKEPPKHGPEELENLICGCNRRYRDHSWDRITGDDPKWDWKKHTTAAVNNAYGLIRDTRARYIRCDIETDPRVLKDLMFNVWEMKTPRLIMCIIGGAKYFKLNERLEREFIKGIIQAALKADGWIVTTGFRTGVVQLVGEAIHDHKVTNPKSNITAVGCSKWGAVRNRESLLINKPSLDLKATMNQEKPQKGQQDLEPNHTHFILLDDGTYFNYETSDYRTRLVTEVSKVDRQAQSRNLPTIGSEGRSQDETPQTPIVTIVVEGGPDTLATICKDLRQDIPIVLIDGSGRVSDLLAKFLRRTAPTVLRTEKNPDALDFKQVLDHTIEEDMAKLEKLFDQYMVEIREGLKDIKGSKTNDKEAKDYLNWLLYCLQPALRPKVHIYSLESDYDLDDTIFEAIIQAKQTNKKDRNPTDSRLQLLNLAIDWDALDVAKEHIIKDDLSDFRTKARAEVFLRALSLDRPGFVDTFIKLNVDVLRIFYEKRGQTWTLKWKPLQELYNKDEVKKRDRLYLFEKCLGESVLERDEQLDSVLRNLVGDYMRTIYHQSPNGLLEVVLNCCHHGQASRVSDSNRDVRTIENDDEKSNLLSDAEDLDDAREKVFRDLFLWAVLTNRIEMSKVFLANIRSRICAALIGSKVCKSYVEYAVDNESKETLFYHAKQFEDYACEALKCCYNYDEEKACEIAIRRIDTFGSVSCLQVAVDADDKNFVGQPCCDQLLTNIWSGRMVPYQVSAIERLKTIVGIATLGLLAPFLVDFRNETDEIATNNQNEEVPQTTQMTVNDKGEEDFNVNSRIKDRLDDRGIDYSDERTFDGKCCPGPLAKYLARLKYFHESPFVKFSYNCVSYIFFLLLFSYFLLFEFKVPTGEIPSIHWTEILVIIIVSTMMIEDIRQFLTQDNRTMFGKVKNYFVKNVFFSTIRATSYILFYIGLILRFAYATNDDELVAAKIILAFDLEIWFLRSLSFLSIAQKMGPKLVMIRKMIIDLFFFTYIIVIAMTAYGVASRTMYDYNNDDDPDDLTFDGRSIFRHVIYPSYYLMYGSTDTELEALDKNKSAGGAIATQVLLAFHMLLVNILLINLLIAMFSHTFESVQSQTDLVWRYERYSLIREYFDRPPLFPPLIILTHVYELLKLLFRCCRTCSKNRSSFEEGKSFKMIATTRKVDQEWSEFESYATNRYARAVLSSLPSSSTAVVTAKSSTEPQAFTMDLNVIPTTVPALDMKGVSDELASMRKMVVDLRRHAEEMNRCMQWMMDAMERVKMSKQPKPRLKSAITTDD